MIKFYLGNICFFVMGCILFIDPKFGWTYRCLPKEKREVAFQKHNIRGVKINAYLSGSFFILFSVLDFILKFYNIFLIDFVIKKNFFLLLSLLLMFSFICYVLFFNKIFKYYFPFYVANDEKKKKRKIIYKDMLELLLGSIIAFGIAFFRNKI